MKFLFMPHGSRFAVVTALCASLPALVSARDASGNLFISLRCSGGLSCGSSSVVMHAVTAGGCKEFCVRFPVFKPRLTCGVCPTNPDAYDIYLDLVGIPSSNTGFFTAAKARWEQVVKGDLTDFASADLLSPPNAEGCAYPITIDDLYICASYAPIDGPGTVLGRAGPTWWRVENGITGLTIAGQMIFDIVDISDLQANGDFGVAIRHEMAHILGIGTLWNELGVAGSRDDNCPYTGTLANAEYKAISGCSVVPTENDFGPGTRCGHWDEECLVNELMTGFLDDGVPNPLSQITIASLEDLGYSVDCSTAEAFGKADLGPGCTCKRRALGDMFHGETRQLGLESPTTQPRRLSDETRQIAIEYGLAYLEEQTLDPSIQSDLANNENVIYVGDRVVSVVVRDGDGIFSIVVKRD